MNPEDTTVAIPRFEMETIPRVRKKKYVEPRVKSLKERKRILSRKLAKAK